jgi:hypothetical protein
MTALELFGHLLFFFKFVATDRKTQKPKILNYE